MLPKWYRCSIDVGTDIDDATDPLKEKKCLQRFIRRIFLNFP